MRSARPAGELQRELHEQLQLLRHSCRSFDVGMEAAGKHIGLTLRVLLYQRGQSHALLDQVGMLSIPFFDSAGPFQPGNLLAECNLVSMCITGNGGRYVPLIAAGAGTFPMREVPFSTWWEAPVYRDNRGGIFSRKALVLHVADTDGGAHVDPELDAAYMAISRSNALGWSLGGGDVRKALEGRPELACMRQIGHELLVTMKADHD